jgi:hypothetical protein
MTISESALPQFSLTISKSAGVGRPDESTPHLCKLFPGLSLSQQGLRTLLNPYVTFRKCFGDYFPVGTDNIFVEFF